ncbi:sugar phosphate isomerase/epimerase [Leeia sp. TBRC 13508]|uniref:Sugar phosphate isomerase/epimerase n=1 Tax=Leeia speluncae TaxID=2884804 RepID=A0ABS8D8B7_9NEIS|nr:sugar phosphate isomerase/epimerase family protein [Leeia speluncae]MCB6184429.1 sugar phosphate isomerase/epimerase [Leeia speluncae]
MKPNSIILHSTATKYLSIEEDLKIATELGFDGIETSKFKVQSYLETGKTKVDLSALLKNYYVPGFGFLIDIERHGADSVSLFNEAESLFETAHLIGAGGVQILTGPVDVNAVLEFKQFGKSERYTGVLGLSKEEQHKITAANMRKLADMASDYGLILYLETLSWAPVSGISQSVALINQAERDNLKIVIDYWHCYTSGVTPEEVSKLDKNLIYGVHVCDSLPYGGEVPNEEVLRDIPTGEGVLDLKEWTDAVKSTGYNGWWSCELFCKKQQEEDGRTVAQSLKTTLENLII